ncbi:HAD family hydrolase [Flavobacterium sp. H122]|uniref:HAD family hydrolase n=1 Tax=Flavobacterium sp. H122 TaxID=2529860 RepID=UPI0010AB01C0|nr:HAD-IA family hydrolase [Flavobacterium sp. H122]
MEINYKDYSHFSFDLWLTLIRSNPEFKNKRNQLFRDFFEADCPLDKVAEIVRYYDVLTNNINEKTGLNLDTYEIYYLILSAMGLDIREISTKRLQEFYNETESLFLEYKPELLNPDIQVLFKKIREEEKTMNILSNTAFIKGLTLRKILSHYELEDYFSFQIYSDEVGFSKPNHAIFQMVYDSISDEKRIEKKKVLHVGDNVIADYNGARNFGFEAYLLK